MTLTGSTDDNETLLTSATADRTGELPAAPSRRFVPRTRVRSPGMVAVAVGGAVVAAVASLLATRQGPGTWGDATTYASVGWNLAHGHGFTTYLGVPLVEFPPGLPILLAIGQWIGLAEPWAARLLDAAAFAGTVALAYALLRRHVRSPWVVGATTLVCALSVPLLLIFQVEQSEAPFVLVTLAFVYALESALSGGPRAGRWLIAAGCLAGCAYMIRYLGVILILVAVIAVGRDARRRGVRESLLAGLTVLAVAAILPVAWTIRNLAVSGRVVGSQGTVVADLWLNLHRVVSTLGYWVDPTSTSDAVNVLVGVVVIAVALVVVTLGVRWGAAQGAPARPGPGATVLGTVVGVYTAVLVISQSVSSSFTVGTRLMVPVFVPCVLLGAVAIDRLLAAAPASSRRVVLAATLALGVAFTALQVVPFVRTVHASESVGVGWSEPAWRHSPLIAAAGMLPASAAIYSNIPDAIWYETHRINLHVDALENVDVVPASAVSVSAAFVHDAACHPSYLVWSTAGLRPWLTTPTELQRYVTLTVVDQLRGGTIYAIAPLVGTLPSCAS